MINYLKMSYFLKPISLIYEDDVKPRLLNYLYTTFLFSDADVDCEFHRSSCLDII